MNNHLLIGLMLFASAAAQSQDKFSQSCAQLEFKNGAQGHTDCLITGGRVLIAQNTVNPAAAAKPKPVPELAAAQREERFWDDAKAIGNKEAFEGYLASYPSGRYVSLANASIQRLSQSKA